MKYKAIAIAYGFLFLTFGIVLFSNVDLDAKLRVLRFFLLIVVETVFVLSVLLLWKINRGAGVFRLTLTSGSVIPAYTFAAASAVVLFMSNLSIFVFNLFYTADIPNLNKFSFFCLGVYVQCFIYQVFLTGICRSILIVLKYGKVIDDYKRSSIKVQAFIFYFTAILSFILGLCGFVNASMPPAVVHVDVKLKNFPSSMDDFKILMVTDVHFGMTVDEEHTKRIMSQIETLNYDLLAVIGDLTDIPVLNAQMMARPFADLKPKHGKYFVTGNHEYYTGDVDDWLNYLNKELGFRILHNEHIPVVDGNHYFYLAGVDDIEAGVYRLKDHGMNLEEALEGCNWNRSVILLAHQPRAAKEALDRYKGLGLVLSGHTHGGQMIPMMFFIYLTNPFFSGLYSYKHGQVYVSQGAVYWGIPMRLFSQAEINVVHLFRE